MLEAPPLRPKDERHSKSGSRPRTPRALLHKIYMIYMSYTRNKKHRTNTLTITTTLQRVLGSKKAPKTSSPWVSSLGEACSNNGLWMAQSLGDSKDPEDRLHLTKTISLGKMAEIQTLTSWGACCLLWP